jgi:hypothetical protein
MTRCAQVDDGEPLVGKVGESLALAPKACVVGTAMADSLLHLAQRGHGIGVLPESEYAGDSAHERKR